MKSGLNDETIESIQGVLSQYRQVGQAILYGSRAKGNYRIGSDIDLTLVAAEGEKLDLNLLFTIDDALDNLLLPYSFDLSIMAEIDILLHDNRNPEQPMYRIAKQKGICLI